MNPQIDKFDAEKFHSTQAELSKHLIEKHDYTIEDVRYYAREDAEGLKRLHEWTHKNA